MSGLDVIVGDRERVLVKQNKEWGEILLGFESKNRFDLMDEDGTLLGRAAEEGKGFGAMLLRNLFGSMRQASIHIYDLEGNEIGRGEKPFRFFFHRMEVYDGKQLLGAVQRKWSWFHRRFSIENSAGEPIMEIFSPLFRIWTFKLMFQGQEVGRISKKWGGMMRELFTDADSFGVECKTHVPAEIRKMLLVATFLIDFTCFENNNRS